MAFLKIFQIVVDGKATRFTFSEKKKLRKKMRELKKTYRNVTFLECDL